MPAPLIPQEIYLIERYSSPEYFVQMRDAWDAMVSYVEESLDRFMRKLPPAYRNRPLPEQPDIVWGQRVLPNFLNTQQGLHNAYIKLTHGDYEALNAAHRVSNDVRGQREFSYAWLDEVEEGGSERYWKLLLAAEDYADNIIPTAGTFWLKTELTTGYNPAGRGALDSPPAWPLYRLNPSVQVKTGDVATQSGVYLPKAEDACANFLIAGEEVPEVCVGYDPETHQYTSEQPTLWTLIERVPGETGPLAEGLGKVESTPLHVAAGKPCPRTGWWFTRPRLTHIATSTRVTSSRPSKAAPTAIPTGSGRRISPRPAFNPCVALRRIRGHVWQASFAAVRNGGRWCPECANLDRCTSPNSKARLRYIVSAMK